MNQQATSYRKKKQSNCFVKLGSISAGIVNFKFGTVENLNFLPCHK